VIICTSSDKQHHFRSTVGHLGIFSDRTRGCPSEAKGWKSWIGFDKVITDSEFKISCFSGDSKCIHAHDFCKSRENQKLCKNSIFQCQVKKTTKKLNESRLVPRRAAVFRRAKKIDKRVFLRKMPLDCNYILLKIFLVAGTH